MCAPDYFGIDYVINPWMEGNRGKADHALAVEQWSGLKRAIEAHAEVVLIPPQPGLPDQVFTANAGMVLKEKVVVSRFRAPERQGEEPFFRGMVRQERFQHRRVAAGCVVRRRGRCVARSRPADYLGGVRIPFRDDARQGCWKKPSIAGRSDCNWLIRAFIISTPACVRWKAGT